MQFLLLVVLTLGVLITANYFTLKDERLIAYTIDEQNVELLNDYYQNYVFITKDLQGLKEDILTMRELEVEIRTLQEVDPTKSYYSRSNQAVMAEIAGLKTSNYTAASLLTELHVEIPERNEALAELAQLMEKENDKAWSVPSIMPTHGTITSGFGYRTSPITGRVEFHTGIDIANIYGSSIYAAASGVVIYSSYMGNGYGNQIFIDHGNGYITFYGHNSQNIVKKGDIVKKGQVIGKVGSTGFSTGNHLHYEVKLYGSMVDPRTLLK